MIMHGVEMVYVRRHDGNGHWIKAANFKAGEHELFDPPDPVQDTQPPEPAPEKPRRGRPPKNRA